MNCRGSGTYAALGNTPSLPRALERHAMPERLMMEDAALAEDARNGSAAAFVKLAKRWWTPLYRVSWNISGSASCAAQITERTLLVRLTLTREPPGSTGRQPQDALGTIREALQRLDPLDSAALVLRETEQLPVEEVAAILSASSEEVRARIHRATLSLTRSVGRSPGQTRYRLPDEVEARHRTRQIRPRLWDRRRGSSPNCLQN